MAAAVLLTIIAVTLAAGQVFAAASYTDPDQFEAAVQSCGFRLSVAFDSQCDGSSAAKCGMLNIAATGLASDGATSVTLTPVVVSEYPTMSSPNSVGESTSQGQFLAGNDDTLTFDFACPVYAFGLYLIGNPAPTGTPAISFWRASVPDIGFDALSSTSPLRTLAPGSDVYFLGIVSAEKPFNQVRLYSNNDPAAVFSFCVDDVCVAVEAQKVDIPGAKALESGYVVISNAAVMRVHADRVNVEAVDRSAGIALFDSDLARGMTVSFLGSVEATADDERVIRVIHIIESVEENPPGSLFMSTLAVGGSADVGLQSGCEGSVGPNNIGLDVTICGRVTALAKDCSWMTVDDGAQRASGMSGKGVKVVGRFGGDVRYVGETVRVTGSVSLFKMINSYYPLIRVATARDVVHLY
ncbi:MAG: hypothetical protein QHI38_06610 [Armatimonadota bacterium]|nr:hypothetical protein [Armatimonadota bacterium]